MQSIELDREHDREESYQTKVCVLHLSNQFKRKKIILKLEAEHLKVELPFFAQNYKFKR